ncbi:MAG: hypothetical protein QF805_29510, partial [Pirellulaceae bacterium]|nr:hypothetical protein [Pirellulaceae bacterium]
SSEIELPPAPPSTTESATLPAPPTTTEVGQLPSPVVAAPADPPPTNSTIIVPLQPAPVAREKEVQEWDPLATLPNDEAGNIDPRVWLYVNELKRYEDPKRAVRRNAELRAQQRRARLASQRWYGISPLRPTVSSIPAMSHYGYQVGTVGAHYWISTPPLAMYVGRPVFMH